jgi:hypothetical protein
LTKRDTGCTIGGERTTNEEEYNRNLINSEERGRHLEKSCFKMMLHMEHRPKW